MAESSVTPAPPAGFELERGGVPPPPAGFELETRTPTKPEEVSGPQGLMSRAFSTARGMAPSIAGGMGGGAAGAAIGTMIAPGPGTAAGALIGEMLGGGGGEYLSQKLGWSEPSGASIALSAAAPGIGKAVKPAWQFAKELGVKSLASRPLVAEAAESLLKKWLSPAATSESLRQAAASTRAMIPTNSTAKAVDDLLKVEINRMPLPTQERLKEVLQPLANFSTVARGKGFQIVRTQNVGDAMADVRRLASEARTAFSGANPNNELGHALNKVRNSLLDDLERAGVPEVREAAKAYRKEAALEELGRLMGKSEPGTKIRDFARDNPMFKGAFTPKEMDLIDQISKKVTFVAPTGGAGVLGRLATMTTGGFAGGPWGVLLGAAGPEGIRTLLSSAKGQQFIERTLAGNYRLGPEWAAAAAMFARGLVAEKFRGGEE